MQADQRDPGDQEENTCFVEDIPLPQGNFRAQRNEFNEGKVLRITADALVSDPPTGWDDTTGFLVRDEDFFVSPAMMSSVQGPVMPHTCPA